MNGPYQPGSIVRGTITSDTAITAIVTNVLKRNGVTDGTVTVTYSGSGKVWSFSYTLPVGYNPGDVVELIADITAGTTYSVPVHEPLTLVQWPSTALANAAAGALNGVPKSADAAGSVALTAAYNAAKTAASSVDYTATRAAKLDFLDVSVTSRSTYAGADTAGTITLLARLTATRAGYLDFLNVGGLVASQSDIQNVQKNTWIATNIPLVLERPDAGNELVTITVIFNDETGSPADIDAGANPVLTLVNNTGTDRSPRIGAWTHPSTGKYTTTYTNSAADPIENIHWELTGTVNAKVRRHVITTQLVDTTAVDFTSADRTTLQAVLTQTHYDNTQTTLTNLIDNNQTTLVNLIDPTLTNMAADYMRRTDLVVLAPAQPDYAPAVAGDPMTLTAGERTAIDTELSSVHGSGSWLSGSGGGGGGLAGPSSVTILFEDANHVPVPNVDFTIINQSSDRANQNGIASFGMIDGDYTVTARTTNGVTFPNTDFTVAGTTQVTVTGTAIALPISADPGKVTAFGTMNDVSGSPESGVTVDFEMIDPMVQVDGWTKKDKLTITSDANGLVSTDLRKATLYRVRRGSGPWKEIYTGTGANVQIPEIFDK